MSASAATAAVSARRMRGPRLTRTTRGSGQDRRALVLVEAAFRPDQEADAAVRAGARQRIEWARLFGLLVAEHQQPPGRPALERLGKRLDRRDFRRPDHAALLASLDRVQAQTLEVDAGDLGVARDDRPQAARAHLDRLLRHIVEPCVLERREQIVDVRRGLLGPRARADDERGALREFAARLAENSPSRPLNRRMCAPAPSLSTLTR